MKETKKKDQKDGFTGIARSVVCFHTNNQFNNFKIVTLHIENGLVVKEEYSDPYASFEAIARLELWNQQSVVHLNNTWEKGKALTQ